MKTAIFKLDDNESGLPGLARVEVIKPTRISHVGELVRPLYKIRVVEIVRPSLLPDVHYRVGQSREVWEGLLDFES